MDNFPDAAKVFIREALQEVGRELQEVAAQLQDVEDDIRVTKAEYEALERQYLEVEQALRPRRPAVVKGSCFIKTLR